VGAEKKGAAVMLRSINNHAPLVNRSWGGTEGRAMPMAMAMWPPPARPGPACGVVRACGRTLRAAVAVAETALVPLIR